MAERLGEYFAAVPLTHLRSSPLERALQTIEPIARAHQHLDLMIDDRVIEAENRFEGRVFGSTNAPLRDLRMLRHVLNPFRPSWGEPYVQIAARMSAALQDAAGQAGEGGQALILSHQLPIWMLRSHHEGRRLFHDPRRRQCALASVTSFRLRAGRVIAVEYTEPVGDLVVRKKGRKWQVGT